MIIIQGRFHTGFLTCNIYIVNTFLKLWSQPRAKGSRWIWPARGNQCESVLLSWNHPEEGQRAGVPTCVINRDYSASGMKSSAEMCLKEKLSDATFVLFIASSLDVQIDC